MNSMLPDSLPVSTLHSLHMCECIQQCDELCVHKCCLLDGAMNVAAKPAVSFIKTISQTTRCIYSAVYRFWALGENTIRTIHTHTCINIEQVYAAKHKIYIRRHSGHVRVLQCYIQLEVLTITTHIPKEHLCRCVY